MKNKRPDKALYQAGRMSNAIDKLCGALNDERAEAAGEAFTQLIDAKHRYDREIEELSRDA